MKISDKELSHITEISELLFQASKSIQILTHISWDLDVKRKFLANSEPTIPKVHYPKFSGENSLQLLADARKKLTNNVIDDWFLSKIKALESSIKMLSCCGTVDFYRYSAQLYGEPNSLLLDENRTPLDLARQFNAALANSSKINLGAPAKACVLAETVANEMRKASKKLFGDLSPKVRVVKNLSANALAGAERIRIRKDACFTDNDIKQLINHEAYVHVATSLNGLAQPVLKILAVNSPSSTKTQEGLAVFAELITGSMDIDRMRRLADRVTAIQMAIEGADFVEVYRYYLERTDNNREQSFENTRRVFRGGVLTGGAPFTKDVVYLDGLLRVNDFLKSLASTGRLDCIRLLFCGKLDLEDIPILGWMSSCGLCKPATFLPPWAKDLRFLISYLTFSSFSSSINFQSIHNHYLRILQDVPHISNDI